MNKKGERVNIMKPKERKEYRRLTNIWLAIIGTCNNEDPKFSHNMFLETIKDAKEETTKEILELIAKKMKKTKELYKDCIESDSLGQFFENVGAYWENDEGYLTLKELKNEIKKKYGIDENGNI